MVFKTLRRMILGAAPSPYVGYTMPVTSVPGLHVGASMNLMPRRMFSRAVPRHRTRYTRRWK